MKETNKRWIRCISLPSVLLWIFRFSPKVLQGTGHSVIYPNREGLFILPENRLLSPDLEHNSLCKDPLSLFFWSDKAFHSHTCLLQVSYNVVVKVVAGASHRTAKVDLPFLLAPHSWVNFCLVSVQLLLQSSSSAFYILCARFYFQQQELEETTVQSSNICMTQVKHYHIFVLS